MLLSIGSVPTTRAQEQPPTATPLPADMRADQCEENDSLVQPCAVPTEIEIGDLTFVDDSIDVYSAILKGGRSYTIRASSRDGIDPAITVFLAGAAEQALAQNDDVAAGSPNALVQITTPADAWYLIQVENRTPGDMHGRSYSLSIRSSAAATTPTAQTSATPMPGDAYENNYDLEHAARLAWGVPYDLSLVCPELRSDACPSGDHDFFLVPVKRGVPFVALTYDLGPGSDTTLTLYTPEPGALDTATGMQGWRAIQGNDDALPEGRTLRSQLMYTPIQDGELLLVVAAAQRKDPPRLPETAGPAGRYRLIVGSPALAAVQAVLQAQEGSQAAEPSIQPTREINTALQPTPAAVVRATSVEARPAPAATVVATAQVGAHGDTEEIIRETCLTGKAVVVNSQGAQLSAAAVPATERRVLMSYPEGSIVSLLGSCYLGWVKVLPQDSVTPGWMFAPDLRLIEGQLSSSDTSNNAVKTTPDILDNTQTAQEVAISTKIEELPTLVATALPESPNTALNLKLQLVDEQQQARAGLRIWLCNAFGDVLREGLTDPQGQLTLALELPAQTGVWVHIPAAGMRLALDQSQPTMTIIVPH